MGMKAFDFSAKKKVETIKKTPIVKKEIEASPKLVNKSSGNSKWKELHIEMWQWLIDNPGKKKSDWPRWKKNGGDIEDNPFFCFACLEADRGWDEKKMGTSCQLCPITIWDSSIRGACNKMDGAYRKWICSGYTDIESAMEIRDGWK